MSEVSMTYNKSFWESPMQFFKQLSQGSFLFRCSSIFRNTIGILPSFVANTD